MRFNKASVKRGSGLLGVLVLLALKPVQAGTFSLGAGWPFIAVPAVTIEQDQREYYINYKLGLDDGFTLGGQWHNGHHVYGAFAGALGARNTKEHCSTNEADCADFRVVLTDRKTTQGLGISYEYRFKPKKQGWAIRAEIGYGVESKTNTNRVDGNLQILYHF